MNQVKGKKDERTGVTMAAGFDVNQYPDGKLTAGWFTFRNVSIRVDDSFAAYLAERCNREVADKMQALAMEIQSFFDELENRVGRVPPEVKADEGI